MGSEVAQDTEIWQKGGTKGDSPKLQAVHEVGSCTNVEERSVSSEKAGRQR